MKSSTYDSVAEVAAGLLETAMNNQGICWCQSNALDTTKCPLSREMELSSFNIFSIFFS